MENEINYIKLDDIIPNRFQPREVFDEVALNELADSIRQHGVIQPIVVRQVGNKYEIIAGERRYKASALAGLTKIPAILKNLDDRNSSIVAYIENAQRRNVSAIEEARTTERILKTNNMTQEQLAKELGISQSSLANKLRLLSLPMEVQDALMKNEISERHARSLLTVKEPLKQIELLHKIRENRMTVRDLDSEIRNMNGNFNNEYNDNFAVNNGMNLNQPLNTNDSVVGVSNVNNVMNESVVANVLNETNNYQNNNDLLFNDDGNFMSEPETFDPSKYEVKNESSSIQEVSSDSNSDFMNFLNNYDQYNASLNPQPEVVSTQVVSDNNDFMNFLNNYDQYSSSNNSVNMNVNGPVINEVNPPITSNFANEVKYVEDNPNYVDVSKPLVYDSLDSILAELKTTINKIKNSKFKIDTDEINFDDIYQITIKVDKREIF